MLLEEHTRTASDDVKNGNALNAMMPSFPSMVMLVKQKVRMIAKLMSPVEGL